MAAEIGVSYISIHAPLRERRYAQSVQHNKTDHFNPRSLAGATTEQKTFRIVGEFQSTLPCGSDGGAVTIDASRYISIHAPLRERRPISIVTIFSTGISIHAPLRERRWANLCRTMPAKKFQSTLPCGSDDTIISVIFVADISIHAPLRERPRGAGSYQFVIPISIHAPLRERRQWRATKWDFVGFQSTLPCGSDLFLSIS